MAFHTLASPIPGSSFLRDDHKQTLSSVGVYLNKPVFTHGQLYVVVSRVTSRDLLKILIENIDGSCDSHTRNIVFVEIFRSLL